MTQDLSEPPFCLPYRGERMSWALRVIGWSKNGLARALNMDQASMRQMVRGARFIPDTLGIWLETLAAAHQAFDDEDTLETIHRIYPLPMGWRPKNVPDRFGYDPMEKDVTVEAPMGDPIDMLDVL